MSSPDARLTAYLLGDLPEADSTALEREMFERPDVFARMLEAESTLVDAYVRHELSQADRDRFLRHYMQSPHNQRRVEFAEALAYKTSHTPEAKPGARASWWIPAAAAAVVLLAALSGWLWLESRNLRRALTRSEASRVESNQRTQELQGQLVSEQEKTRRLSSELDNAREQKTNAPEAGGTSSRATAAPLVSLLLTLPSTRSPSAEAAPTLTLPSAGPGVRLQLALADVEFSSYQVSISAVPARPVVTRQHLRPDAASRLTMILPAGRLAAGDYLLSVSGERGSQPPEPLSQMLFRVVVRDR